MKNVRWSLALGVIWMLAVLLLTACAKEAAVPEVSVTAADFSFTVQDTISGGLSRVRMTNSGKESHHAQFLRLNDGVTLQKFQDTLQSALRAVPTEGEAALNRIFAIVTFDGGPGSIGTGGQSEVVIDLSPGQYVLVCFVPSPDGVPHIAKGMVKPLKVTAAPATRPSEPKAKATVALNDFAFVGFPELKAGKTTLKLENKGKEPHEMAVYRAKGIPAAQLQQILTAPPPPAGAAPPGPPPFEEAGGFQAIMAGKGGWVTLDLTPGEYVLVCFVPSPANKGAPHTALGMVKTFTVR